MIRLKLRVRSGAKAPVQPAANWPAPLPPPDPRTLLTVDTLDTYDTYDRYDYDAYDTETYDADTYDPVEPVDAVEPPADDEASATPVSELKWAQPLELPTEAPRRGHPVIGAIAVIVTLAVVALVITELANRKRDRFSGGWDPKVADLVEFVETERGLLFKKPIEIVYLSENKFVDRLAKADDSTSDKERAESDTALLRALGLAAGPANVDEQAQSLRGASALAFYSPSEKKVYVRGAGTDATTRVTLVHELTHALDDQHFDLQELLRNAKAQLAGLAMTEGSAVLVERAFVRAMSDADRQAYTEATRQQVGAVESKTAAISPVLRAGLEAPYRLGPAFIAAVNDAKPGTGLNDTFRNPPESEADVMFPSDYLSNERPRTIVRPALGPGEQLDARATHSEPFGAFGLYLLLAAHLDDGVAYEAARAWGGDEYVQFKDASNRACVRLAFAGRTGAGTTRIADALDRWASSNAPSSPKIERGGDTVKLTACDPGPQSSAPAIDETLGELAFNRAELLWAFVVDVDLSLAAAECAVDHTAARFDLSALDAGSDALPPALSEALQVAVATCRR